METNATPVFVINLNLPATKLLYKIDIIPIFSQFYFKTRLKEQHLTPKNSIMEIKWIVLAVLAVISVALIVYLIIRNQKDEKELITFLNETELNEEELKQDQEKKI